jgi:ubiquinone/menaquinone biosynthesis C-methylase UbiE
MEASDNSVKSWDELSKGRKEWESLVNSFLYPISSSMINQLSLTPTSNILDVATGMGEPGLSIAAIWPAAKVTGVDISEKMLKISQENAQEKGIKNFETICCDVTAMPFADNYFDAIICRNGIMFFADMAAGLKEIHRVLKSNGKVTVSAWGQLEKNLWISIVLEAITIVTHRKSYNKHIPGMFYCMEPGFMTDWFEEIDLQQVKEQEITVSAAVVDALKKVDSGLICAIREEVKNKISTHLVGDKLYFQWNTRITTGMKRK